MNKLLLGTLFFVLFPFSYAQDDADSEIEEIVVIGELSRSALEEQIVMVQNEIYRIFNDKNSSDDFDFTCRTMTPTGTHISRRICEPKFLARARQRNITDSLDGLDILLSSETLQAHLKREYEQLNAEFTKLYEEEETLAEVMNILAALNSRLAQL